MTTNSWDELAKLEENWDSYNARPITPEAIDLGRKIERVVLEGSLNIVPTVDGGVSLEWHVGDEEFSLEISPERGIDPFYWKSRDEYWPKDE